jgi:ABC-2 type transport system permease protein
MIDSSIALDQFKRSLAIARKDLRVYYAKGPVVIFGILMPAFLFLAFSIGRQMPLNSLIPGLLGMAVFFTATAVSPVVVPWETQARTLERLASCPVAVWTILLGDMLASVIFGAAISLVPILVGLISGANIQYPFILAIGVILAALCFSSMALIFSFPVTSSPATIMMLSSLIKFPLVFVSGVFMPVGELPAWAKVIASLSPLTYFTEVARYCMGGTSYYPLSVSLLLLLMFTILFWGAAVSLHKRTLPKRL